MTNKTTAIATNAAAIDSSHLGAAMFAVAFGAFLLFGAGFAPMTALHNAAHDARHAISFPCH